MVYLLSWRNCIALHNDEYSIHEYNRYYKIGIIVVAYSAAIIPTRFWFSNKNTSNFTQSTWKIILHNSSWRVYVESWTDESCGLYLYAVRALPRARRVQRPTRVCVPVCWVRGGALIGNRSERETCDVVFAKNCSSYIILFCIFRFDDVYKKKNVCSKNNSFIND